MAKTTNKRIRATRHWTLQQKLDYYTDKSGGADACWPWRGVHRKGYGYLWWKDRPQRVTRLTWAETNGPIPKGMHVLHRCDNPPCRNEAHLFLGTHAENVADKVSKGRQTKGEDNPRTKLTEADVLTIRTAIGTQRAIAKRYGITKTTVGSIQRGETWRHLA